MRTYVFYSLLRLLLVFPLNYHIAYLRLNTFVCVFVCVLLFACAIGVMRNNFVVHSKHFCRQIFLLSIRYIFHWTKCVFVEFHNFAVPIMNRNTPFICAKNKHIKVAKNFILAIFVSHSHLIFCLRRPFFYTPPIFAMRNFLTFCVRYEQMWPKKVSLYIEN